MFLNDERAREAYRSFLRKRGLFGFFHSREQLKRFKDIQKESGAFNNSFLGIKNIKTRGVAIAQDSISGRSLQKGILVNALSPHPYLFWFSVGGPIIIKAMKVSQPAAILFICSFYVLLVGAKIFLAVVVSRSRSFLLGNKYIFTMRLLGFILIILAVFLLRDGLHLLGIL